MNEEERYTEKKGEIKGEGYREKINPEEGGDESNIIQIIRNKKTFTSSVNKKMQ